MHSSLPSISTSPQTTLTPLTTSTTPPPPSSSFDPLFAFLDEQWPKFNLSLPSSPSSAPATPPSVTKPSPVPSITEETSPLPPNLHALASQATTLTASLALWQSDFDEAERQIRAAILDADAADAARHALDQHSQLVLRQLDAERRTVSRLRSELHALQECFATLHQAHTLEDRINRLVISDQAEEIRQLRLRVEILEKDEGDVKKAFGRAAEGLRKGWYERQERRRKEKLALETSKERLFEGFRKKHSTTVESIVQRTSTLSMSREGETGSGSTLVSHSRKDGT